jgi:3-phosphoshikimate 1-carboxyvinyltransferase
VARGRLAPPPSKSVTHRYLNLVLLAGAPATVRRPLLAEDTRLFLDALAALGWAVEASEEAARLAPRSPQRAPPRAAGIDCGNAGTLFRFLTASLAVLPGAWRLDGTPRLRERPVGPLVAALLELGARIEWAGREGFAPLVIHGGRLAGGRAVLDAGESSQYLSALLMAALRAEAPVELEVPALTSHPYVELTRAAIRRFAPSGDDPVEERPGGWRVRPARLAPPPDLAVEGDFSAACYPAAAAVLTGGRVVLDGLAPDSAQGDRRFLELLSRMGGRVAWRGDVVEVEGPPPGAGLTALDADLSGLPDQVPTLAALAPFARGVSRIHGVPHLRIKESDRLRAMAAGLGRLGVPVEELPDGLVIHGCWADAPPGAVAGQPAVLDPVGDHRIAMSLALVGLRRQGVAVADPEVVGKSYPGFWRDLDALLAEG